ncbi:MAG: hypothetical protein HY598_00340 [Candidatus Omnitrophica bacterium]|nr:hypothetical protein [Candidatus Omnitrophota bacterium]
MSHRGLRWLALLLWATASPAEAMAPEQAYALLRHQEPVFNPAISVLPNEEAAYFGQCFAIVNQAVVQRVEMMTWLSGKGQHPEPFDRYDDLLFQLKALQPPEKLREVHRLTMEAVEQQRDVIREWQRLLWLCDRPFVPPASPASEYAVQPGGGGLRLSLRPCCPRRRLSGAEFTAGSAAAGRLGTASERDGVLTAQRA